MRSDARNIFNASLIREQTRPSSAADRMNRDRVWHRLWPKIYSFSAKISLSPWNAFSLIPHGSRYFRCNCVIAATDLPKITLGQGARFCLRDANHNPATKSAGRLLLPVQSRSRSWSFQKHEMEKHTIVGRPMPAVTPWFDICLKFLGTYDAEPF
jgi:hypothetical protein